MLYVHPLPGWQNPLVWSTAVSLLLSYVGSSSVLDPEQPTAWDQLASVEGLLGWFAQTTAPLTLFTTGLWMHSNSSSSSGTAVHSSSNSSRAVIVNGTSSSIEDSVVDGPFTAGNCACTCCYGAQLPCHDGAAVLAAGSVRRPGTCSGDLGTASSGTDSFCCFQTV